MLIETSSTYAEQRHPEAFRDLLNKLRASSCKHRRAEAELLKWSYCLMIPAIVTGKLAPPRPFILDLRLSTFHLLGRWWREVELGTILPPEPLAHMQRWYPGKDWTVYEPKESPLDVAQNLLQTSRFSDLEL